MAEEIQDFWSDKEISSASERGLMIQKDPKSIMPPAMAGWNARPKPELRDSILSALMGFQGSTQAALDASKLGDPLLASIAAISGGAGAVARATPEQFAQQRQAAEMQQQMAQLESMPVDKIAPGLVAEYPEFAGLPLSIVHKLAPFIQRKQALEQQAALFMAAEGGRNTRAAGAAENLKTLGSEAAIKVSLAQDGIRNIADARKLLSTPSARKLILKAGGSWKRLSSLGDPEAEILANAIFQIADAEARLKTGAAINLVEMDNYFSGLVPKSGTMEGITDRLDRKLKYFEGTERGLSYGRKVAPKDAVVSYSQTATNPKTGDRLGKNSTTGKWEPIK